jgi:hypothetical protein
LLAREFLADDRKDGWRRAGCEANGAAAWVGGAAGMFSAVRCGWRGGGGEGVEGRVGGRVGNPLPWEEDLFALDGSEVGGSPCRWPRWLEGMEERG